MTSYVNSVEEEWVSYTWPRTRERLLVWGAPPLPDPADVGLGHRLARLAGERLLELRHVLHHAVDAEFRRRVRVGGHLQAQRLLAIVGAPHLAERKEEALLRREAVRLLGRAPDGVHQRLECHAHAAVVRRVFAQGELAVDVCSGRHREAGVFIVDAGRAPLELLGIGGRPPVL